MAVKVQYKTKHYQEIMDYLKTIPGKHVTASEICSHFKEAGSTIGTATVYRQLERLVSEGLIVKMIVDENTGACFVYEGDGIQAGTADCFHCKCVKCGKLIHMECREVMMIAQHMKEHHDFIMDTGRIVFYGTCGKCYAEGRA